MEKQDQYAFKILAQIQKMFEDTECENYIDMKELGKDDNATHFLHAIMNIAPAMIANNLTGSDYNYLEANHVANHLVFQYLKPEQVK